MKTIKFIGRISTAAIHGVAGFIIGIIIAPLLAVALPFCFAWDAAHEIGMFGCGKE